MSLFCLLWPPFPITIFQQQPICLDQAPASVKNLNVRIFLTNVPKYTPFMFKSLPLHIFLWHFLKCIAMPRPENHKKIADVHFPENLSSVVFASFKTLSPHLPTADPHLQATHREGRSYRLVFLQQEHWTIDLQNLKSLGHFKRQIMFNLSTIWHDFSVTLTISIFVPQHNENSISRHWNRFINSFIYL